MEEEPKKSKKSQKTEKPQKREWTDLQRYQKIGILMLLIVIAGTFGWIWEFLLAEFEGGFQHLYINGGNLLPWMNIYAYGALLILAICYHFRKKPWLVFLSGAIVTGTLEFIAGWLVYTIGNGTRYWDYNIKWYGWGTIGGFICPASVIAFGLGAVMVTYVLMPWLIKIATKMSKKAFLTLSITLFSIIIADDITNLTLKNLNLPTAQDLYRAMGWIEL